MYIKLWGCHRAKKGQPAGKTLDGLARGMSVARSRDFFASTAWQLSAVIEMCFVFLFAGGQIFLLSGLKNVCKGRREFHPIFPVSYWFFFFFSFLGVYYICIRNAVHLSCSYLL